MFFQPEKDVEFTVGCSDKALINVTWKSGNNLIP